MNFGKAEAHSVLLFLRTNYLQDILKRVFLAVQQTVETAGLHAVNFVARRIELWRVPIKSVLDLSSCFAFGGALEALLDSAGTMLKMLLKLQCSTQLSVTETPNVQG
jgi:hypothetical protein